MGHQCTSVEGLMISIRWYSGFPKGSWGVLVVRRVYKLLGHRHRGLWDESNFSVPIEVSQLASTLLKHERFC